MSGTASVGAHSRMCVIACIVGSCASGSDDIYLFNRTLGEVKYNMLWFYDGVTPENGTLWGHGVNDGYIVTKAPNGVSSVTLYNNITEGGYPY